MAQRGRIFVGFVGFVGQVFLNPELSITLVLIWMVVPLNCLIEAMRLTATFGLTKVTNLTKCGQGEG